MQLILQRLAPDAQPLPVQPLLLQLAAQQLRLLFGLGTPFLRVAQLSVSIFQCKPRVFELFFDAHAPLQELLKLHTQLFQRSLAFFQVERELLTAFDSSLELLLQTIQRLSG